jgi:hypothetical protein
MKMGQFVDYNVAFVTREMCTDPVLRVRAKEDLGANPAWINRVARDTLRVKRGDNLTFHPCPNIQNAVGVVKSLYRADNDRVLGQAHRSPEYHRRCPFV